MQHDWIFRPGTPDDSRACHQLLFASITDFAATRASPLSGTEDDWWTGSRVYYDLLATDAAEWWVAADETSGELIGYARSIEADGLLELTEFFVRPGHQSRGIGRELIARAFPADRGRARVIIATSDVRALARYYGAGVAVRFPFMDMIGKPRPTELPAGLTAERVDGDAGLDAVRTIERSLLGFERSAAILDLLFRDREAYLYRRADAVVGFAFVSPTGSGPIGAVEPAEIPDILHHVEGRAYELGMAELDLQVPSPNEAATRHLLARGFRFDPFVSFMLSDRPFGQFDRLIPFSPPLFL
jgi:GNAT superfamily N-acetyltransferase